MWLLLALTVLAGALQWAIHRQEQAELPDRLARLRQIVRQL